MNRLARLTIVVIFLTTGVVHRAVAQVDSMAHHHENHMDHQMPEAMTHSFSLSLPMNRNGSGTGWLPDQSPMYAWMKHGPKWNYMLHGAAFFRQNFQNLNNNFRRGGKQFDVPNWIMGMAQRRVGKNGLFMTRFMVSFDPITVGGSGYPLLFQSGESYQGNPLVNRQHPHDLISELSVGYTHRFSSKVDLSGYLGWPGEPALGPVAFMHRISSLNNPDAPLGHHWQDATHVTFGVATIGLRVGMFKWEGSSFTGREPDEHRFNLDRPRFDSYSSRVSISPSKNWVLQASRGWIRHPEILNPTVNVVRTTASAIYSSRLERGSLNATLVWGFNDSGHDHQENSILAELNVQHAKAAWYGRYEFVQKSSDELQITTTRHLLAIHATTVGGNYQVGSWFRLNTAVGAQVTLNAVQKEVEAFYGRSPVSAEVYIRVIPDLLR